MPSGTPPSSGHHGEAAAGAYPLVSVTGAGIQLHESDGDGDVFSLSASEPREAVPIPQSTDHDTRGVVSPLSPPSRPSTVPSPRSGPMRPGPSVLSPPTLQLPPSGSTDARRGSSQSRLSGVAKRITLWKPREYSHWKSPLLMVLFYGIGLALSIAHCVVYRDLDGKVVGSSRDQEQNLRYGTAFSFIAQLALTASCWTAYTQRLWRAVQERQWTVNGLNKAFGADTAPSSLLSLEVLRNFPVGALIAFFAWCLVLPPFFTPATLFVYQSEEVVQLQQPVPSLSIAHSEVGGKYAYSPPMNKSTVQFVDDPSKTFCGPRTILTLLSTATASRGEILPIKPPYNHSSYAIQFHGPVVRCAAANASTVPQIDQALAAKAATPLGGTAFLNETAYYAFVPARDEANQLVAMDQPRYQQPSNASNELWMYFERYDDADAASSAASSSATFARTPHYQVCRLHNVSYDVRLAWDNGFQNISAAYAVGEAVLFPHDRLGDVSDYAQHAYSAFLWTLTDQLVGLFGWYVDSAPSAYRPAQFGAVNSPVQHNSILGSSDLDVFFTLEVVKGLYLNNPETPGKLSQQRRQDKALARNRTLEVLIEELSVNMTVSLLHNELLTYNTTGNVTKWNEVNRYGYLPYSLFIPYALANFFSLITVILGLVSCWQHGVLPDKKFQDIASAAGHPDIVSDSSGARGRRLSLAGANQRGSVTFHVRHNPTRDG